jgi:hypothetical protein
MICKAWEAAPIIFKPLKMEKNWERSAKVFDDRLVFGDGPVYPRWFLDVTWLLALLPWFTHGTSITKTRQTRMSAISMHLWINKCIFASYKSHLEKFLSVH